MSRLPVSGSWWMGILFAGLLPVGLLQAEEQTLVNESQADWPEVLTLEYALAQAHATHPDLQIVQSQLLMAKAAQREADSSYGLQAELQGRLRWVEPSDTASDPGPDDHRLGLFVVKSLYDFGRTAARQAAAVSSLTSQQQLLVDAVNQHRLAIMQAYFNVLLADLAKARDEEAMSGAFIRSNRLADRNERGQVSDIDLYKSRSDYQKVRESWYRHRSLQQTARAELANILNRPRHPPVELATPQLSDNAREAPREIDEWWQAAETNNPRLLAASAAVIEARQKLDEARAGARPMLRAELEAAEYSRNSGGHDKWRAGLSLNLPLLSAGQHQAELARQRAELTTAQARFEQQRREVRQAVLEQWHELNNLQVARERAQALMDYRNLYLDRSRTLYELEVKSDLGDAMTKSSEARLENSRVEFALALAWARLDALLGREVYAADPSIEEKQP